MSTLFDPSFMDMLAEVRHHHNRTSSTYKFFDSFCSHAVSQSALKSPDGVLESFGPFGQLTFPYVEMGAVNSLDLFGLDELIIFSFYWANRTSYRKTADLGANLGLHSIIMSRCGLDVTAYEPDPHHYSLLSRNVELNNASVVARKAAVSAEAGRTEFVRVMGNTTSSHIKGSKDNAYGELQTFEVEVASIRPIMQESDFIKMDVEGQEAIIIQATSSEDWEGTDVMLEIGSTDNAAAIHDIAQKYRLNAFVQKLGWQKVQSLADMPTNYKEGSLFLTRKEQMPWG